jgi:sporulation protein YlmC with PRC-barrel domain
MTCVGERLRSLRIPAMAIAIVAPLATGAPAQQQVAGPAVTPPQIVGALRSTELIGATVMSSDGELVGAVDDLLLGRAGETTAVVIGLAGYLGLGEKDVAMPFSAVSPLRQPDTHVPLSVRDGRYGGSSAERVRIDATVGDLASAPAFKAGEGQSATGRPSSSSGAPESVTKEPKSSTKSGGPG